MELLYAVIKSGLALLILGVLFLPMERVFPAKKGQGLFRKDWMVDLCFFLGQYLLWHGLVVWVISVLGNYLIYWIPSGVQASIGAQPFYLQVIEVLIFSDLIIYWGHRLQHRGEFLWRFHKVHHSAQRLDWLAAHREHPLDSVYTIGLINLPAIISGFPLESISVVIIFRGIWAVYIHSNVRLPLGPLKILIGSPELHHWHHDLDRDRGNYANISPVMDVIFGTYTCPDHEPEKFGIKENFSTSYAGQLLEPMFPKRTWNRIRQKLRRPSPLKPGK